MFQRCDEYQQQNLLISNDQKGIKKDSMKMTRLAS